ncbi:hypothetical protein J6590_046816 [Homalodisca vitripennis]|nr:hypothetical protein J6590_046816 [Homalodisca vitripennis]
MGHVYTEKVLGEGKGLRWEQMPGQAEVNLRISAQHVNYRTPKNHHPCLDHLGRFLPPREGTLASCAKLGSIFGYQPNKSTTKKITRIGSDSSLPLARQWGVPQGSCLTHKVLCLGEPRYVGHKLSYREEITQRSTRQDRKLHFP